MRSGDDSMPDNEPLFAFAASEVGHGNAANTTLEVLTGVAFVVRTVDHLCLLCHAPDGVALPQFLPQSARRDH